MNFTPLCTLFFTSVWQCTSWIQLKVEGLKYHDQGSIMTQVDQKSCEKSHSIEVSS